MNEIKQNNGNHNMGLILTLLFSLCNGSCISATECKWKQWCRKLRRLRERGRDMHSYMIRKIEQCSDNPIQSNTIQSNTIRQAEESRDAANLVGLSNSLVFCFGKGFSVSITVFFLFLPWFIKTFTSNYGREMGVWTLQKSHPLITVIYLPNRRKLFHFDWSSQGAIKQNPRNAKWKVKSVGKGSEPQNKGHKNEAKKGKRQE